MARLKGLSPEHEWVKSPNLAQELLDAPDEFFSKRSVKTEDYACPKEVHDALDRARAMGKEMESTCADSTAKSLSRADAAKALRATVEKHFGKDFVAETMPYGILFKERANAATASGLAITGTGSCTFCSDNDSPDVD